MTQFKRKPNNMIPRGRFTPPGLVQPTAPRDSHACPACVAEAEGRSFSFEDEWERTKSIVSKHGLAIQYVTSERPKPSWAYTIGRVSRGLPELLIVGVDPPSAAGFLNRITESWDHLPPLENDGTTHIPTHPELSFALLRLPDTIWQTDFLLGASRYAREEEFANDVEAMMVVWPDRRGLFPWDEGVSDLVRKSQQVPGLQIYRRP
jgi:hypothetical protein